MSETMAKPERDENGVPRCTMDDCPAYDGKRCGLTGFRPGDICEPAVIDLAAKVERLRKAARARERKHARNIAALDGMIADLRAQLRAATGEERTDG